MSKYDFYMMCNIAFITYNGYACSENYIRLNTGYVLSHDMVSITTNVITIIDYKEKIVFEQKLIK